MVLINSRRIFYWSGACSLSQIAVEGSKNINDCKIALVVPEEFIANVIEIIPMTKEAVKNKGVIKVPYKAQELLDRVDPAVKTVMDAYESQKAKHANKIDFPITTHIIS